MTLEIRRRERLVWVVFLIFAISLLSGGSILIRTWRLATVSGPTFSF